MRGANLGKVEAVGDSFLLPYQLQTKGDSGPPGKNLCALKNTMISLGGPSLTCVGKKRQKRES